MFKKSDPFDEVYDRLRDAVLVLPDTELSFHQVAVFVAGITRTIASGHIPPGRFKRLRIEWDGETVDGDPLFNFHADVDMDDNAC